MRMTHQIICGLKTPVMLNTTHINHAGRTSYTPLNQRFSLIHQRSSNRNLTNPLPARQFEHTIHIPYHLPLRLLPVQKPLQNRNDPLQRSQPSLQLLLYPLFLPLPGKLSVEVLAVRTRAHRGAEDGLHHEAVMWFQSIAVRGAEGGREFFGGGGQILG